MNLSVSKPSIVHKVIFSSAIASIVCFVTKLIITIANHIIFNVYLINNPSLFSQLKLIGKISIYTGGSLGAFAIVSIVVVITKALINTKNKSN